MIFLKTWLYQMVYNVIVMEENCFLYPLKFNFQGLWIKLASKRITRKVRITRVWCANLIDDFYTEKNRQPKEQLDLESYMPFWQLTIIYREVTDKRKGVGASRSGKLWEDKCLGKLMEDKVYFGKICLCRLILDANFLFSL